MNTIEKQTAIIDQLAQLVVDSIPDEYHQVVCTFDYDFGYDDGSYAVGSELLTITNGNEASYPLIDGSRDVSTLVVDLRKVMKFHTNGEWSKFAITLDENGKVHTQFYYPDRNSGEY